ncbi:glutathione S-transferase family protein [Aurantiacibacter suaedae]|uniref:glutathione S-transferase family protein n=1 Tax=Aurantiacibacter suaedae TaxID=2545755 RepID=UPI0010F62301|nr:glutathione S-transferase [Aurantiacibacter suaedae]
MKLYDLELSGNCYKVRLFCALIGQPITLRPVNFLEGEHKSAEFIERNPFGEIPVLIDGDVILRNSQAMLAYLARKFDREDWYPTGAREEAEVMQWLMVAENEIARGPNDARLHDKFAYKLDVEAARIASARLIEILDKHLSRCKWLALSKPTIADVACFPYVALAHEGGISLEPYTSVRAWLDRVKALPNFLTMPAI